MDYSQSIASSTHKALEISETLFVLLAIPNLMLEITESWADGSFTPNGLIVFQKRIRYVVRAFFVSPKRAKKPKAVI